MAEDGDDSGKEDKDKKLASIKPSKTPAVNMLPKCSKDLSQIETAVDNLARVNLILEESGCKALKSYCRATFDALIRQADLCSMYFNTCIGIGHFGLALMMSEKFVDVINVSSNS